MDEHKQATSGCPICGRDLPPEASRCPACDEALASAGPSGAAPRLLRIREPGTLRPLQVVLICLVVATVGGGMLLLSAAKPVAAVDGAIPWNEQSPLRAVVQLLCLNYQVATPYAGAVKNYLLGLGAGLAILALSIAVAVRARSTDEESPDGDAGVTFVGAAGSVSRSSTRKSHLAPLVAAQVLVAMYLLWSFASTRWSQAGELAFGASVLLTVYYLWAFALGNGLGIAGAVRASRAVIVITALTAIVAVWYHYGRKPTMRIDFPVGNPTFLAACLIPGFLLCVAFVAEQTRSSGRALGPRLARMAVGVVTCVLVLWAFHLADSRGPLLGLVFGVIAMAFFAFRGRLRWLPVLAALAVVAAGWVYYQRAADASLAGGRSASLRLRTYAWSYAWSMFNEHPFKGHGQAGFVLGGDAHAADDVLDDPLVFESRIAHAHNEWLEVMADLGAIGIVLILAAVAMTLRAGALSGRSCQDARERWTRIALLASLVGLCVDACFGVGLRVSGVPTMFYTVLGLCWALSGDGTSGALRRLSGSSGGRMAGLIIGGTLGVITLVVSQQDFASARFGERAKAAITSGDFDEAIRLLTLGTNRLNPQRALSNLFLLSDAHLRAAQALQSSATEREHRARDTEPVNQRLLVFADQDYKLSDEHCDLGIGALKELIKCSPDYLNQGRIEYYLSLTRVQNAATRDDPEKVEALLSNALRAVERELKRQPFEPAIAVDYVRVAAPRMPAEQVIATLARPLRHHRLGGAYVELLRALTADPVFNERFQGLVAQARRTAATRLAATTSDGPDRTWAPETLRLGAAAAFLLNDHARAKDLLTMAARTYDTLTEEASMGAASCYAELADSRFYTNPGEPSKAIESAVKALSLAPRSFPGRQLGQSVETRMIDYYLAGGNEDYARSLLSATAPTGASEDDVRQEIAARYARLCESIMSGFGLSDLAQEKNVKLVAKLQAWATRAAELDPKAPMPYVLLANLSLAAGRYDACAEQIQQAMKLGMPVEEVKHFLDFALQQAPDNEPLKTLRDALTPAVQRDTDPQPPAPAAKGMDDARPVEPEHIENPGP